MALRTATVLAAAFALLAGPAAAVASAAPAGLPTWDQLYAQQTLNREHTAAVFPKLDPAARNIDLSDFGNNRVSQVGGQSYLGGEVYFTDKAGAENVYLQVSGPTTADTPSAACRNYTRCQQRHETDGSTTVVVEYDEATPQGTATTRIAEHLRTDGTLVLVEEFNYLPIRGDGSPDGAIRGTFPLTVDQLLTLARDGAYKI